MSTDLTMMDLTGENPLFKRTLIPFRIYKANQIIELREPVFSASVMVQSGNPLTTYTNFTKGGTIDDTTTSKIRYAASEAGITFSAALINRLTVTGYTGTEFTIYVTYQSLYRDPASISGSSIGPDYSPELMMSVLNKLSFLQGVLPPIPDITVEETTAINVLEEDITGTNPDNYIKDEIHLQVNTLVNRSVVRPAHGSFYKKDLLVKLGEVTLVEDIDYKVVGINLGKTRVTTSNDSVYDYIVFTKAITTGTAVTLNYRAFGGMVCPITMNQTRALLKNIIEYIKLGNFVTADNLKDQPIIVYILDRLRLIEDMLNISAPVTYLYNSKPTDTWVDIAHIAPDGITGLVDTRGVGHIRIRTEKYFAEVKLNYDLDSTDRVLTSHTISSWATTVEQDSVAHITNRVCPKFRIVWNTNSVNSGIVLQMSITRSAAKNIYVEMQNYGGAFSNWALLQSTGAALTPITTTTTLPDNTVWDSSIPETSAMSNTVIVSGKGYTVFIGNMPVHLLDQHTYNYDPTGDPQDNSNPILTKLGGLPVASLITGTDVIMSEIEALVFKVYDRYTGTMISKISDNLSLTEDTVKASVMYFDQDMCAVEGIITKTGAAYNLSVGATTGTHSSINERFNLRQIDILFKGAIAHA